MEKKTNYKFVMENYNEKAPFTGFLPGLAGKEGIPIWAYYVNRGQGICTFGIQDKSHAIMEFQPAVRAYEETDINGFRTFLLLHGRDESPLYLEPFSEDEKRFEKSITIEENRLVIEACSDSLGLQLKVTYYILPNENFGGLVRRVEISNLNQGEISLEGLDGMPRLIPYGIRNEEHQSLTNILRSFTLISNIEHDVPFFTLRSTTSDETKVGEIKGGVFVYGKASCETGDLVYDRSLIFGEWGSLRSPILFKEKGLAALAIREQEYLNKFPCAFLPFESRIKAGAKITLEQIYGYANNQDNLDEIQSILARNKYFEEKEQEALEVVNELLEDIHCKTAYPIFDQYIRQSYLDNFLRGGYPEVLEIGGNKEIVNLYSRKHGDPERDYNFFIINAEPWSQGNGNFRDVCQNRRNDAFFLPYSGIHNLKQFIYFIQADGYNPLEIQGLQLKLSEQKRTEWENYLESLDPKLASTLTLLSDSLLRPGTLFSVSGLGIEKRKEILNYFEPVYQALHREGYWIDHFVYLLDLLESCEKIWPDYIDSILFDDTFTEFYQSAYYVLPRLQRYVQDEDKLWQYHGVAKDEALFEQVGEMGSILKGADGQTIKLSLFGKLFLLATIKFSTLDVACMGIEMEAGKPGWNDALNGLPALFGSSVADALELLRLLKYLTKYANTEIEIKLPVEFMTFLSALEESVEQFEKSNRDDKQVLHIFWDQRSTAREAYRQNLRQGWSGEYKTLSVEELLELARRFIQIMEHGISKAQKLDEGIIPTFLSYSPTRFEEVEAHGGSEFCIEQFNVRALPSFLEAPAKALKVFEQSDSAKIYEAVQQSNLYDSEIGMYKTSVSLEDESILIGRIRSFTPGWQERESIFIHMHYKFLYGLLQAGLYESFFTEAKRGLLPFYDEEKYGRSITEHSSFIASSVNPDPLLRGRGFVMRLSGATAEMLSMWLMMTVGKDWFSMNGENLTFTLAPILAGDYFDENGNLEFTLLSTCLVQYCNPLRYNTYPTRDKKSVQITSMTLYKQGKKEYIEGNKIQGEWALALRNGGVERIEAVFGEVLVDAIR